MIISNEEIKELSELIARMIVTEGEILTEAMWASRVADIIKQYWY